MLFRILLIVFVVLLAIQFFPVNSSNPPVTDSIQTSQPVSKILRESCFDCHSNETDWPWYSKIAPVSWMISHHVAEGRKHLNFSTWESLSTSEKEHKLYEIASEVKEKKMPIPLYLALHKDAKLDSTKLHILSEWTH